MWAIFGSILAVRLSEVASNGRTVLTRVKRAQQIQTYLLWQRIQPNNCQHWLIPFRMGPGAWEEAKRALFWLSEEAWAKLEPHLPKNQP